MTLIQLRYLVAIVDADLNISVAAQRVHTTQPAISKQLKQIEEELNFQIFLRKGRTLERVSESGAEVIERARIVLNEVENIRAAAANRSRETRGHLRIAASATQSRSMLPLALSQLKERYPRVSVSITAASASEALALLERDQADLAILNTTGERPSGEVVLPLYHWSPTVIVLEDHPLAALKRALSLTDLAQTPLVTYGSAVQPNAVVAKAFEAEGLKPSIACTSGDSETIKSCVRRGLGVGLLAGVSLGSADADLVQIPVADMFPDGVSWAVLKGDRVHREYLFELLGVLRPGLTRAKVQAALDGDIDPELMASSPAWPTLARA